MRQTPTVSKNYSENNISDYKGKINKEFCSSINVKDLTVIDFGVGESTEMLINLGAKVMAVDRDVEKLKEYDNLGIPLIKCDIANLPFDNRIADLAVFYFTLHEIDPRLHKKSHFCCA
mgnify:CR=1 FL=1